MSAQPQPGPSHPSIAIIGAGFSGLCAAIRLKQAGYHDLTVYEAGNEVGGVWRDNTYPGAACDVPWHLYSFSFEHRTGFNCPYPEQPDIHEYQKYCARKYALYPHIRFNARIARAVFDDDDQRWRVEDESGQSARYNILITGMGQLSRPAWPAIPGRDTFAGHSFHSARWDHDHDLAGRKVGVIGTGASAIQFVPQIAPDAAHVRVFQRSAPYLLPRFQRRYGAVSKWLFDTFPRYRNVFRFSLFELGELGAYAFHDQSRFAAALKWWARSHRNAQIKDAGLRGKLTPDYPIGCKRVLFSSDYYPALTRANVDLETQGIERMTPAGVVTTDGRAHQLDTIIYATGFKATQFLAPVEIRGRAGIPLAERWGAGAEAYKGITVDGFPNMFMCYGPNTNLGGNSIIYMIECQVGYIVDCLNKLTAAGQPTMEVRADVITRYNDKLQDELAKTVWSWGCSSWYHTASGRITNNWPGTNGRYKRLTRAADLENYRLGV